MDYFSFASFYNEIGVLNKEQKWPILYHRILDLDLTEPRTVKKYLKHVESALKIFNYTLLQTMPSMREPSHINHLENCFLLFFQVAIANMPTDMFVETVNNFNVIEMCANYLANILKVLVGKKKLELSSLTDGYLHFTKSIIVFMRNEKTQQSSQYPITLALIRLYSEMEVYGHCVDNGAAFKQCYALIEMAVKMCSCVADRDKLIDNLILQLKQFKANNKIETSIKEDTAIAISHVFYNSYTNFIPALNEQFLFSFCKIVRELYNYIRASKLSKSYHTCNCADLKRHTVIEMGFYAYSMFVEATKQNAISDRTYVAFYAVYQQYLIALQTFKCQMFVNKCVDQAFATLNSILSVFQPSHVEYGVKLLNWWLDNRSKLPLMTAVDDMYILNTFTTLLWSGVDKFGDEFLRIATLYLSHLLDPSTNVRKRSELIELIVFRICDYQTTLAPEKFQSIATIFVANKSLYKIKAPPSTDTVDLLICQLKFANKYGKLSPMAKETILKEIFESNVESPVKSLRAIFVCEMATINSQSGIQTILRKAVGQFGQLNTIDQLRLILVGGTFSVCLYFKQMTEWDAEHRNSVLNVDILHDNVFLTLNIEYEMKLIELLYRALRDYEKFVRGISTNFCNNLAAFQDEIPHIIDMLRKVADQCALRNHSQKAMVAYQLLYTIASMANDEFGQINAVGYFAEHPKLFAAKQIDCLAESLEVIIARINGRLLNLLETLSTYSARKKKQILYALLSISIYYLQSEATMNRAKIILRYVDGVINEDTLNGCGKFDSVPCKYYYVMFEMLKMNREWVGFSASEFAQHMNESIKSLKIISADDAVHLPTLLFNFMVVSCNYAFHCGDYENLETTLLMMLKWAQRIGVAYRCGQLLLLLVEMHVLSGKVVECEAKCAILDAIYGLHDHTTPTEIKKKTETLSIAEDSSRPISIRKSVRCLSPLKMISNGCENIVARYITGHLANCNCVLCANKDFDIIRLHLATNAVRLLVLKTDYQSALLNFEYLYEYYTATMPKRTETLDPITVDDYCSTIFRMLFNKTMSLLRNNNFEKAQHIFAMAKRTLNKMDFVDCAQQQQILVTDHMIHFQMSEEEMKKNGETNRMESIIIIENDISVIQESPPIVKRLRGRNNK